MPLQRKGFDLPRRIERAYRTAIHRIVGRVLVPKLPEETFEQWIIKIAERSQDTDVREASKLLAKQMVAATVAVVAEGIRRERQLAEWNRLRPMEEN